MPPGDQTNFIFIRVVWHPKRNLKVLGFGGSMVARLKLKGIDGRAPQGVEPAA